MSKNTNVPPAYAHLPQWAFGQTKEEADAACALVLELSGLIGEGPVWWESTFVDGLSYVADSLVIWLILVVLILWALRRLLSGRKRSDD